MREAQAVHPKRGSRQGHQAPFERLQTLRRFGPAAQHERAGTCGSRRPHVACHIRNREIRLVPHPRHNGHGHCTQQSGNRFAVKAPEVRKGPASSHKEQNVDPVFFLDFCESRKKLAFGRFPLHRRVIDDKGHPGRQDRPCLHHVLQSRRFGARHHTHGAGIGRKGLFDRRVEEPFGKKLFLKGFKAGKESAVPHSFDSRDVELQLASPLENVKRAGKNHRLALLGKAGKSIGVAPPDDAVQQSVVRLVLEIEIDVPGRVRFDGVDFALNADRTESVQSPFDAPQNRGDADGDRPRRVPGFRVRIGAENHSFFPRTGCTKSSTPAATVQGLTS